MNGCRAGRQLSRNSGWFVCSSASVKRIISPSLVPLVPSTKPTGKGMGLGLTVARKFMELHGGRVTLANAAQRGAEATLLFKPL